MSFDSLVNAGEYLSAHYLAEMLPKSLKSGRLKTWAKREKGGEGSPRSWLRGLRQDFTGARGVLNTIEPANSRHQATLHELHDRVLEAFGFTPNRKFITVEHSGEELTVPVLHAEREVLAIECGWATSFEAAFDVEGPGQLPAAVDLAGGKQARTGSELVTALFGAEEPPRYILMLVGAVVILADRYAWGEGRYLAVNLDAVLDRNDTSLAGELDTVAALFSAEALHTPDEGGENPLAQLVDASRQHSVAVSTELRIGLQRSVELIANEVLARLREADISPADIDTPDRLANDLARQSLRYLYRILFLLYAETRPELGILPADYPEYAEGYGMARLGELVTHPLTDESAGIGFHLYESLDLLFGLVNHGYRTRAADEADPDSSEDEGIRFEKLNSDLFDPARTNLIGWLANPAYDEDEPDATPQWIDTRLRNKCLRAVLRLLMLSKGRKRERGGFISYAQLGINQLGAVYEGLMSYTGFIAEEELYEVAKGGDAKDGSWMIPATKANEYPEEVFVSRKDEETDEDYHVRYPAGSFVYRLAGRDRETSASYYTPESLTKVTVQLALEQRLKEADGEVTARQLLNWTICEPALGSGAFLNEAVNQLAAEYLRRRQRELGEQVLPEDYEAELRKVKAYLALHNSYGVDLNAIAVELAEVSIWLNVMHPGLQAPWFGLHLRRGNSLIGAGRRYYTAERLPEAGWSKTKDTEPPTDLPFRDGDLPEGGVHHFLLPAIGWGAVASEKEAKDLAPDGTAALAAWRRTMRRKPTGKQIQRLQSLARRAEYLWQLVVRRLTISQNEISRRIDVWGQGPDDLPHPNEAVGRQKVYDDLHAEGTPYWRLKTLMDTWCALWFWPVQQATLLNGTAADYATAHAIDEHTASIDTQPPDEQPFQGLQPAQRELPDMPKRRAEQVSMFEQWSDVEVVPKKRDSKPKPKKPHRRNVIPLSNLDDWLDFAESLLGTHDNTDGTIISAITRLDELDTVEESLPVFMGMDGPNQIVNRYPWFTVADEVADKHGFFHWELDFAHIFASDAGGFDLQLGNPPWVRPEWDEPGVLAELDPWFELTSNENVSIEQRDERRRDVLSGDSAQSFYLDCLTSQCAMATFLSSPAAYDLLVGTRVDLYRGFMIQSWRNAGPWGAVGLLHRETHLTGDKEKRLRQEAYRRLRVHGEFVNVGNRFFPPPVSRTRHFGVHIYGGPRYIQFEHVSWMFDASTLRDSLHQFRTGKYGADFLPGVKLEGDWDTRPHPMRVVQVNVDVLATWRRASGNEDDPVEQAKLYYPVSTVEHSAINALGENVSRISSDSIQISSGYNQTGSVREGLTSLQVGIPSDWSDVILHGAHIGVSTPFFKQAPHLSNSGRPVDLSKIQDDHLPCTKLQRKASLDRFLDKQDRWIDYSYLHELLEDPNEFSTARHAVAQKSGISLSDITYVQVERYLAAKASRRYTEFYRIAWRETIFSNTDRSLFAAVVPPGATHVHAMRSMALSSSKKTSLSAGFFSSLPLDYLLRVTGREHLDRGDIRMLPFPDEDHPLAAALLLRTMRLNCLTGAYRRLWEELYVDSWRHDQWAVPWPNTDSIGDIATDWRADTPLRREQARRAALVEIDALVSVWLGLSADQLVAIFLSRYPVLAEYESQTWFDVNGHKLAGNFNAYGHGQTKEHFRQLMAHLEEGAAPPEGYEPPFYEADRPREMREAHAEFSRRLQAARDGEVV